MQLAWHDLDSRYITGQGNSTDMPMLFPWVEHPGEYVDTSQEDVEATPVHPAPVALCAIGGSRGLWVSGMSTDPTEGTRSHPGVELSLSGSTVRPLGSVKFSTGRPESLLNNEIFLKLWSPSCISWKSAEYSMPWVAILGKIGPSHWFGGTSFAPSVTLSTQGLLEVQKLYHPQAPTEKIMP